MSLVGAVVSCQAAGLPTTTLSESLPRTTALRRSDPLRLACHLPRSVSSSVPSGLSPFATLEQRHLFAGNSDVQVGGEGDGMVLGIGLIPNRTRFSGIARRRFPAGIRRAFSPPGHLVSFIQSALLRGSVFPSQEVLNNLLRVRVAASCGARIFIHLPDVSPGHPALRPSAAHDD